MTEQSSGSRSEPSTNSSQSSLGLPSAAEIEASVQRLKERMHGGTTESDESGGTEKPQQEPAAENGRDEPGTDGVGDAGSGQPQVDGQGAEAAPGGEPAEAEGSGEGKPRTLKETADRLKTSASSLYEMEVPLNDGSGRYLSVEDLKAGYLAGEAGQLDAERHEFAVDKARHEQARIEQENRILQSQRELTGIMDLVKGVLPPAQLAEYQRLAQEGAAQEARKLAEVMPQFRDQAVYQGWLKDTTVMLGKYGFNEAEANNIADHRIYKLLDDHQRLLKRVAELTAMPIERNEPPKPVQRRSRGVSGKTSDLVARAKRSGSERDKVAAVRALIEKGR